MYSPRDSPESITDIIPVTVSHEQLNRVDHPSYLQSVTTPDRPHRKPKVKRSDTRSTEKPVNTLDNYVKKTLILLSGRLAMTLYLQHRSKSPNQPGPIMKRVYHSKYLILMLVGVSSPVVVLGLFVRLS